mgnify:CR=1 FL=1
MNYYLMIHNYPPIVVFYDSKDLYYKALEHYDKTGDISQFVAYMKDGLEATWHRKPIEKNIEHIFLER